MLKAHSHLGTILSPDEQYVLKGRYSVGVGDRVYEVREGDSIYIPPGTAHWYENTGNENAEFLCIVPKKEKYESVYAEADSQPK